MIKKSRKIDKINKFITYFIVLILLIALCIEFINQRWGLFFITVLAMLFVFFPYLFQRRYRIYLPSEIQLATILFIYASLFLGEVQNFYVKFWWWDSFLHLFSGFVIGLIAFGIMYVLYKTKKVVTDPKFICVLVFSIALAIGGLWEIFEFGADQILGIDMQKSKNLCVEGEFCDSRIGVMDTMADLILDAIGALFAALLGYIYLKRGDQFLLNGVIERFVDKNPNLFYKK